MQIFMLNWLHLTLKMDKRELFIQYMTFEWFFSNIGKNVSALEILCWHTQEPRV